MKHKPFLSLLIFSILIFNSSCRKVGNGFIEGHVYEMGYNTPVAGVSLKMVQLKNGGRGSYASDAVTDSEGYFKMKFQKKIAYTYEYYVDSDKYLFVQGADKVKYKKEKVNVLVMTKGFLKLTVKNNLNEDLDFYITNPYSYTKVKVKAQQAQNFSLIPINGFGETNLTWYYITDPTKKTSDSKEEIVSLYSKSDTLVKTIEIN